MACECPSGYTLISTISVGDPYCQFGACTSGSTTYAKTMWAGKQISCKDQNGNVRNIGCDVKAGCCA